MTSPSGRQGLYADPVLYDILHAPGTAAEVDALARIEQAVLGTSQAEGRWWFEPACGTGRYLRVAARRGLQVAGFDQSRRMIAYARRRLAGFKGGCLFTAEMTDFLTEAQGAGLRPGVISFAFNPVNTLRHLPDDVAVLAHLDQLAAFLAPGAAYVVGISLVDYDLLWPEEDVWEGTRGDCSVQQVVNYLPPEPGTPLARTERVISHLTVRRPSGEAHLDDAYELRSYDAEQWRDLVQRSRLEFHASFDGEGRPLAGRTLPYQLDVLVNPG